MKVDIAEIIRLCLDEGQPVHLEGVGTLRRVNLSAEFGDKRESILPPSVDIVLDSSTLSNDHLVEKLSSNYKLSKKKATKHINDFNKSVFNGLVNYSKVNLVGIGLIEKSDDGNFTFTADKNFVSQYYKGLPEVQIQFIDRSKKDKQAVVVPSIPRPDSQKLADQKEEDIEDVAFANLLNKIQEDKVKKTDAIPDYKDTKELKNTTGPSSFADASATTYQDKSGDLRDESVDSSWNPQTKKSRNYTIPILIGLGVLLLLFTGIKACQWITKSDKTPVMTSVQENQNLGEDKGEELASLVDNMDEESGTIIPDECVIITGVFATQNNIDRMVQKLESNGYVPYLEAFGPYTRTGIKFACNDLDLESYIRNVRSTIEPKAWYLDPDIHVAYELD